MFYDINSVTLLSLFIVLLMMLVGGMLLQAGMVSIVKKEKEEQSYIRRDSASTVISDIVSEGTKRLQAEKAISDKSREQLKEDLDKQKAFEESGKWQLINIISPLIFLALFGLIFNYYRRKRFH
jgi:Na+-transporting NADH:ubiquinone oxidoreductase subunit NqrC